MFIDTHSHLFAEEFDVDRPEVMVRAKAMGVGAVCMPNIDLASVKPMLSTCDQYRGYCYPMLGLHPTSVSSGYKKELAALKLFLVEGHPFIAIGEVGMDLYWDKTYLHEQLDALDTQIQWALEWSLPLVIHCREAFDELYACLFPYRKEPLTGVFHCFTGSADEAARFSEFEDFFFGVNGAVTYKKSPLPEMLKSQVPLQRIVLETDSPYLSPVPFRGKRNESSYIVEVAKKLSEVYALSLSEVERITSANACKLFNKERPFGMGY